MNTTMKKRWISLYVENQVGVLPKISGLFSGKIIQFGKSYRRNNGGSDDFANDD